MKVPNNFRFGRDYDGWALPMERRGGPPYWSHFVGCPEQPALPTGCVPVKLTQASYVVVEKKSPCDIADDEQDWTFGEVIVAADTRFLVRVPKQSARHEAKP